MHRYVKPAALTAAALLAVGSIPGLTAQAAPDTAASCVSAGLVWVHVEYDTTVTGACADKFATASEALLDSGLGTETGDYITTVDGRTADQVQREWWSVYSKAPKTDGTFPAAWDFAQVGVTQLKLAPSSVLALVLQPDWDVDAVPPVNDPVGDVTIPSATPTPSASPSTSPSASATATPSATASAPTAPGVPSTGN